METMHRLSDEVRNPKTSYQATQTIIRELKIIERYIVDVIEHGVRFRVLNKCLKGFKKLFA